jgi:histidinol-phosphate aminotransferase
VSLNTNENSYPLPEPVVAAVLAAVAGCARGLNRYPDREFSDLRADLAGYLNAQHAGAVTPDQIWAGNGSNEVLQHLVQAFAGPGRVALGFTPSYSMHPLISTGSGSTWVDGRREADFDLDPDHVCAQIADVDPAIVFLCSPNNPTGTAPTGPPAESSSSTRPTPNSPVRQRHRRSACCRVGPGWWSPAR